MITERQNQLLNGIITEYINSARPVSSQLLEKKYDFGISPATIRIEMQKLTDKGFLHQPHTSAGRIPTDKGYRFFVDNLLEREPAGLEEFKAEDWFEKQLGSSLKFIQAVTKNLASASSGLALGYLLGEKILWKEGWKEIFQEPEFTEAEFITKFIQMLEEFEKNIEDFILEFPVETRVYIGKENPISKAKDFSIIASKFVFPDQGGIFAILGPKRMSYPKNIYLINSVVKLLKNY